MTKNSFVLEVTFKEKIFQINDHSALHEILAVKNKDEQHFHYRWPNTYRHLQLKFMRIIS